MWGNISPIPPCGEATKATSEYPPLDQLNPKPFYLYLLIVTITTMSRILRRFHSTSTQTAETVARQFLQKHHSLPPNSHTQVLDANQLQRLGATLHRPFPGIPPIGTPLPPCYHLAYFTPWQEEAELGSDGTDTSYNPDAPFTRRMWAGGTLAWDQSNVLRVGQSVTETTKVVSAAAKRTKAGEDMVVVGVEKRFENEDGVAVTDTRSWIFRPAITSPQLAIARPTEELPFPEPTRSAGMYYTRDFLQTPVTLFRFSALTFNAHKIHYNKEWCREVEGHRDLVVHGPLNLTLMVDFWRDTFRGRGFIMPKSITYRATHPLYAGEPYRIILQGVQKMSTLRIFDSYGNICMTGTIIDT